MSDASPTKIAQKAPSRLTMGQTAAILGLISTVGPLAIDMYLPSFPAMAADLHTSASSVELSLVVFLCAMAVGQLMYGPLTDAFGRKRPLQAGLALFAVATVGCAISPDIRTLLFLRVLQGLGACSGMTVARAIVRDKHTGPEAAKLLSMMVLVWGVSPLFAPLAGSLVLQFGGWRSIFWILAALVVATFCLVTFALEESHPHDRRTDPSVRVMLGTYLRLLQDRKLMGLTFSNGSWSGSVFAFLATSPFVFAHAYGLSPMGYGVMFGVCASGMVMASQANAWLMRRLGAERQIRLVGLAAVSTALILTTLVLLHLANLPVMMAGAFALFACQGVSMTPASVTALDTQGANAGAAAALMGALQLTTGSAISAVASGLFAPEPIVLVGTQLACMTFGAVAARFAFRKR